ncbi:MAG: HlyD family efflux transporter periplasmic adaptor subunit [Alphaproteobacteria bacterium]
MDAAALPPLRDELTLHPGPVGVDGAPTWTLHDPLRNQFFRLSWPAVEILSRWHLGTPDSVAAAASAETTLHVAPEDVVGVAEFLGKSQLLKPVGPTGTKRLLSIAEGSRTSWATWLLHHYLFFRIPLVRPDAVLGDTLPLVAWAGGRGFRLATLTALLVGVLLVGRQWDAFATTLVDHFSLGGMASFGVALAFAKVIHELGHAFTAKSLGCRVPTMGVAFLVMWPVLYTDVNEAWKLTDRRQRVLVGAAGILAELSLAAWATLAWALLPDGMARSMAFTLAATTWVSSLAINLSPFLRFDGYFLVMDWLDMPNLHGRSFALARWWLREVLFGLGEPVPERLPPRRRAALIAFAVGVWIYRLVLFLGIAILVYHFFIKVVGIFLFVVEIGWFVVKPVMMEVKEWHARAGRIVVSRRARVTFGLLSVLLLLAVVPWSGRVSAPALLKAGDHVVFYAPSPARLEEVAVHEGQGVTPGTIVARMANPDLDHRLAQAERRIAVLRYELGAIGFDEGFRGRSQATARELESALAERSAAEREKARLTLETPIGGIVTDLSLDLHSGQWVSAKDPILAVRATGPVIAEAYVGEDDLPRITSGMGALFIPEGSGAAIPARVEAIDRTAARSLADPSLAAPFGGPIPARLDKHALVPDAALYRVRLGMADAAVPVILRGEVHIQGERRSLLGRAFRAVAAVVIREWGT